MFYWSLTLFKTSVETDEFCYGGWLSLPSNVDITWYEDQEIPRHLMEWKWCDSQLINHALCNGMVLIIFKWWRNVNIGIGLPLSWPQALDSYHVFMFWMVDKTIGGNWFDDVNSNHRKRKTRGYRKLKNWIYWMG